MNPDFWSEAIKGLVAAGPVAVVLGIAVKTVWGAYQDQIKKTQEVYGLVIDLLKQITSKDDSPRD